MTQPLGGLAVGVFFLMSGYGLEYSYQRKGDGYLKGFLKKRVWKLLLPYLIVIVLWNVEECFLYPDESPIGRLRKANLDAVLPYSWYVIAAMLFYIVFWLSHKLMKREVGRFLAIVVSWIVWFAGCCFFHRGVFWYVTSHMFLLGILYCKFEKHIKRSNAYAWMIGMLVLAVVGTLNENVYWSMLFGTAFSLLFVCGITLCEYRSKVMDFLGKISYEMYLVQALPIFALNDSGLSPLLIVGLCISIDLLLAYMLHLLVSKMGKYVA